MVMQMRMVVNSIIVAVYNHSGWALEKRSGCASLHAC